MKGFRFAALSVVLLLIGSPISAENKNNKEVSQIQEAIQARESSQLGRLIRKFAGKNVSLDELAEIASQTGYVPLANATRAAIKLSPKQDELGLTTGEFLESALFIETNLAAFIEKQKYYLPATETHLATTIEYDPETKRSFINLIGKKAFVGEGKTKKVTKAIFYNSSSPEIVARLEQSEDMEEELQLMKQLQGLPGLYNILGATGHSSEGKIFATSYTTLYSPGAFIDALDNGYEFSLYEKAKIAFDLLQGLEALHARGLVHRDLHLKNYFLDVSEGEVNKRKVTAVIADFGRMRHVSKTKGLSPQANPNFTAPEGLLQSQLKGDDYLATDVYALGMTLHRLLLGTMPKWKGSKYVSDKVTPEKERYQAMVAEIDRETMNRRAVLSTQAKIRHLTAEEQFEALILRMLDPDHKKRGTASDHRREMKRVLNQTYPK